MPNTLAHIGVQGVASRFVFRQLDPKWIYLGCVIPDIPWISQRILRWVVPSVDLYDLRLYAVVQSALFLSLLLCAVFALVSSSPIKIFLVLSLNSIVHLFLDACQTKLANGVHFFAPFSWKLVNFRLFWPESLATSLLSISGLMFFILVWRQRRSPPIGLSVHDSRRLVATLFLLLVYTLSPFLFMAGPELADNHSVKTLREKQNRAGKTVEFDRAWYGHTNNGGVLRTFAEEELAVLGQQQEITGRVSVRATFLDQNSIAIRAIHHHSRWTRDLHTIVGLALVSLAWLASYRGPAVDPPVGGPHPASKSK